MGTDHFGRVDDLFAGDGIIAQGDVLQHGSGKEEYILQNQRYPAAQGEQIVLANVDPIDLDCPFLNVVKAIEDIDDGRFARTRSPHNGERFAWVDMKTDVFQHKILFVVGKPHPVKVDLAL